jgi:hypothetical protein
MKVVDPSADCNAKKIDAPQEKNVVKNVLVILLKSNCNEFIADNL